MSALVHVIVWNYSDGGSCGVIRAYESEVDAQDDLALLQAEAMSGKNFSLFSIPVRVATAKGE